MTNTISVPVELTETTVRCFGHQGKECHRCDGSGHRPRKVCAGCGKPAKSLLLGRPARSWKEAKALPMYCFDGNPRFRFAAAVMAMLDAMDS